MMLHVSDPFITCMHQTWSRCTKIQHSVSVSCMVVLLTSSVDMCLSLVGQCVSQSVAWLCCWLELRWRVLITCCSGAGPHGALPPHRPLHRLLQRQWVPQWGRDAAPLRDHACQGNATRAHGQNHTKWWWVALCFRSVCVCVWWVGQCVLMPVWSWMCLMPGLVWRLVDGSDLVLTPCLARINSGVGGPDLVLTLSC